MKSLSSLLVLASVALGACGAPATVATSPAPTPAPAAEVPAATTPSIKVPAVTLAEAPRNWQLLDVSADHVPGISVERAYRELLAGKSPKQTVVVAIIDNGIDTLHADLRASLWSNPKEVAGNAKDDDNNGFADDVRGWNFIGGRDGQDVHFDTFEVTREYARCHNQAAASGQPPRSAVRLRKSGNRRSPIRHTARKWMPITRSSGRRSSGTSRHIARSTMCCSRSFRCSSRPSLRIH